MVVGVVVVVVWWWLPNCLAKLIVPHTLRLMMLHPSYYYTLTPPSGGPAA